MKPEPNKTSPKQQARREPKPEGVVQTSPHPPHQSQTDEERGDWEGMGQSRFQPEEDKPKSSPPTKDGVVTPRPSPLARTRPGL